MNFKAFIPYRINQTRRSLAYISDEPELLEPFFSRDPSVSAWGSMGYLAELFGESPVVQLDGLATMLAVQINERILPAKVRDEHLVKRIADLESREGRKVGRKEYAQLREAVEQELLPQAFIKRTTIPVMFFDNRALVFTSSHKRADDVTAFISRTLNAAYCIDMQGVTLGVITEKSISNTLSFGIVAEPEGFDFYSEESNFAVGTSAVFKGKDKKTIRMKNEDIESKAKKLLLDEGYLCTELALTYSDDNGNSLCSFTVTDSFTIKSCKLTDFALNDHKAEDAFASAWLVGKVFSSIAEELAVGFGGLRSPSDSTKRTAAANSATSDEDDEL